MLSLGSSGLWAISTAVYTLTACIGVMLCRILSNLNDIYNKMLEFSNLSTQIVLLITALSIALENDFLIDIALLYASINFVSTIALMKLILL